MQIENCSNNTSQTKTVGCETLAKECTNPGSSPQKIVLIFVRSFVPNSAVIQRAYSLCELCKRNGLRPVIATFGIDFVENTSNYDVQIFQSRHKKRFWKTIDLFYNSTRVKQILKEYYQTGRLSSVLIYSVISSNLVRTIKRFCGQKHIKLIFDVVEFQNFSSQKFKSFFLYYCPNVYINRIAITKRNPVISISCFCQDFFTKRGIASVQIPFINVGNSFKCRSGEIGDTTFLYAGFPGKKDEIVKMIRGFLIANKLFPDTFRVFIAGVTIEQLHALGLKNSEYKQAIPFCSFLGNLPTTRIKELYGEVDFTILLKDPKSRRSIADFPSKVVQSMGYGVPVVSNLTSDLKMYLTDRQNSVIVAEDTADSFAQSVRIACLLSKEEKDQMRRNAFATAQEKFSVDKYVGIFGKIVK
jgi:glycosyltransferase involved in cell wall biosynthesis